MITIEKAKEILLNEQGKFEYTDNELKEIIDFLEVYAKIAINNLKKTIANEKCNSLRKGFH